MRVLVRSVYVRLWTRLSGTWQFNDYTYRAATSQNKATLTSPPPGSTLAGATVSFGWSAGTGATEYWLEVGTTGVGSTNLYSQSQGRSEERRVGKECRSRWSTYHYK